MKQDKIFSKKQDEIKKFEFNEAVSAVFDDMVSRSVPFYDEIHRLILDILDQNYQNDGIIYDLGCSTGTTINIIDKHLALKGKKAKFIGIDNSAPMLSKCDEKLKSKKVENYSLIHDNIENVELQESDLIIMNYTLQFISPEIRVELLKKVYQALKPGSVFILSEKIKSHDQLIDEKLIDLYYNFKKRNGYSELEISQKREALENFLIPITTDQQMALLKDAGFSKVDQIFRWYNFSCFMGIK